MKNYKHDLQHTKKTSRTIFEITLTVVQLLMVKMDLDSIRSVSKQMKLASVLNETALQTETNFPFRNSIAVCTVHSMRPLLCCYSVLIIRKTEFFTDYFPSFHRNFHFGSDSCCVFVPFSYMLLLLVLLVVRAIVLKNKILYGDIVYVQLMQRTKPNTKPNHTISESAHLFTYLQFITNGIIIHMYVRA